MKDSIKNRKNKLLALCLSALMLSSVAALGACKDSTTTDSSTSSSSEATSTENDTGLIKNANFKTYDKKNAINTSVTGWSRSTNSAASGSALSSKAASGIIDLDSDAWNDLTGTNTAYNVATMTEEEAEAAWDELTIKDKLAYYDRWKKENSDGTITKDLSFYEAFNIDSGDIPTIARFDTHHKEGEGDMLQNALMSHGHDLFHKGALIFLLNSGQQFIHIAAGIAQPGAEGGQGFGLHGVAHQLDLLGAFGHA